MASIEDFFSTEDEFLQAGSAWRKMWTRAELLGAAGELWHLEGAWREENTGFYGPFIGASLNLHIKLLQNEMVVGELIWPWLHATPTLTLHESLPVPDFSFTEPTKIDFTDEQAAVLWLDFTNRLKTLHTLWLEHVTHWKEQGLSVDQRWSMGISMHGQGELVQAAYDENGHAVMAFTYEALSGELPKVEYFDGNS